MKSLVVIAERLLALSGDGVVVSVVGGVDTETAAGEGLPNGADVLSIVAVLVGLDPGIASSGD